MKGFTGQVRVLADEPRGGQILRVILTLLGTKERAEVKGTWAGWTKGANIIDHVRQELGMAGFDTFSKMLMLGLVENPEAPAHKTDQWRLTKMGEDAYAALQAEEQEEEEPKPAPADHKRGRRGKVKQEEGEPE